DLRAFSPFRARSGNTDFDVPELRLDPFRPGAFLLRQTRLERIAARCLPSLVAKFAKRCGDVALHEHGQVVPPPVESPGRPAPPWIAGKMLRGVPPPGRHVDPAAGRNRVIDDNNLLVVTTTDGMGGIELEADPFPNRP